MSKELAKAKNRNMTLYELSIKNETSFAVCYILANRDRHRSEPLRVTRFAGKVRVFMAEYKIGEFSMADLYDTIDELSKLSWVKIGRHRRTQKAEFMEFLKPISTFGGVLAEGGKLPSISRTVLPELAKAPDAVMGLPTKLIFVMHSGKVTMEVRGNVEDIMKELKDII